MLLQSRIRPNPWISSANREKRERIGKEYYVPERMEKKKKQVVKMVLIGKQIGAGEQERRARDCVVWIWKMEQPDFDV